MRVAAAIAAVCAAGALLLGERRASACEPSDQVLVMWPPPAAVGVPTDATLWLDNGGSAEVEFRAGDVAIGAVGVGAAEGPNGTAVGLAPSQPLSANTEYTVTATKPSGTPYRWQITTGAGPAASLPELPLAVRLTVRENRPALWRTCLPLSGRFVVSVRGERIPGAVLYQLEVDRGDGAFAVQKISTEPSFDVTANALPTPRYRVRPVSGSGAPGAEALSPPAQAFAIDAEPGVDLDPGETDRGGCQAAGGSSAASLGAVFLLGMLARRRRGR